MEAEAAKLVGAGLAAIGMIGAGIGVGNVWASYISAISRNPASKGEIGASIWIAHSNESKTMVRPPRVTSKVLS